MEPKQKRKCAGMEPNEEQQNKICAEMDLDGEQRNKTWAETGLDEDVWRRVHDEILEQILVRLPVTALLRNRLVCKRWSNLSFVDSLLRASRRTPWLYLSCNSFSSSFSSFGFVFDPELQKWRRVCPPDSLKPVASGGGLLCFRRCASEFVLYNPITGRTIRIPPIEEENAETFAVCMRRGNESRSSGYQILTVGNDVSSSGVLCVRVYSSSNGLWLPPLRAMPLTTNADRPEQTQHENEELEGNTNRRGTRSTAREEAHSSRDEVLRRSSPGSEWGQDEGRRSVADDWNANGHEGTSTVGEWNTPRHGELPKVGAWNANCCAEMPNVAGWNTSRRTGMPSAAVWGAEDRGGGTWSAAGWNANRHDVRSDVRNAYGRRRRNVGPGNDDDDDDGDDSDNHDDDEDEEAVSYYLDEEGHVVACRGGRCFCRAGPKEMRCVWAGERVYFLSRRGSVVVLETRSGFWYKLPQVLPAAVEHCVDIVVCGGGRLVAVVMGEVMEESCRVGMWEFRWDWHEWLHVSSLPPCLSQRFLGLSADIHCCSCDGDDGVVFVCVVSAALCGVFAFDFEGSRWQEMSPPPPPSDFGDVNCLDFSAFSFWPCCL